VGIQDFSRHQTKRLPRKSQIPSHDQSRSLPLLGGYTARNSTPGAPQVGKRSPAIAARQPEVPNLTCVVMFCARLKMLPSPLSAFHQS
jgi:hypothetical protein